MKRLLSLLLSVLLLLSLTACGREEESSPEQTPAQKTEQPQESALEGTGVPEEPFVTEYDDKGYHTVQINGDVFWTNGTVVREPENDFDLSGAKLSDYWDTMPDHAVSVDSYALRSGTPQQTTVYHIDSGVAGPTVYIVGGVHGDELAGWYAGTILRQMTLACGEVYLLSCANVQGAKNGTRYVTGTQDLNRSFPGKDTDAGRLAKAIFDDIAAKEPELLLDLHEAIVYSDSRDFLGSTLIFTDLAGMEELFFDTLTATQLGEICEGEFGYTGPGPDGSINAAVTTKLGIPAITVETFRGYPVGRRVSEQLDIVHYILNCKGML